MPFSFPGSGCLLAEPSALGAVHTVGDSRRHHMVEIQKCVRVEKRGLRTKEMLGYKC